MLTKPHVWKFWRSGGFDQVCIEQADDLRFLADLDPKLWAALACPTRGLRLDQQTLSYLDQDGDGRIRLPEVLASVRFVLDSLADPQLVFGGMSLRISDLRQDTEVGQRLAKSAQELRMMLKLDESEALTLEHIQDRARLFPPDHPNGDGVVPVALCTDPDMRQAMDVMIAQGQTIPDRSGEPGIDAVITQAFFEGCRNFLAWQSSRPRIAGLDLDQAWSAFDAIAAKIDDFFARCQLINFDASVTEYLNPIRERMAVLASGAMVLDAVDAADVPLAQPGPEPVLQLGARIHPAWQSALDTLVHMLIQPVLGPIEYLTLEGWRRLREIMQVFSSWKSLEPEWKPACDLEVLQAWVEANMEQRILDLIECDCSVKAEADAIMDVDRLLHFQRYLVPFLNNFVTLRDFYSRRNLAVFQAGRLYLDQRSCDLCVEVDDVAQHSSIAGLSRTYLVYCLLSRAGEKDKAIVAAVTAGEAGAIMVGRHALFFDREGRDWDAKVTKLIENPISVREAFWTPYRKMAAMLGDQIQKMAKSKEQGIEKAAASGIDHTLTSNHQPVTPTAFDVGKFAGIFAAIGLALGALGSALASLMSGILALHWWQVPLVPVGVVALVSGPSMLLAWFKLHARNLGPILEGNGWAINSRARINIVFGTALTQLATLPDAAERSLTDPYAEERTWQRWLGLAVLLAALLVAVFFHYRHF